MVTAAVDTPFFPGDLVPRLALAAESASGGVALARSGGNDHPTFGLWPVGLRGALRGFLQSGEKARVRTFADMQGATRADFPDDGAFGNLNTLDDLARADLRFVNRPEGSGTRVLTDLLLKRHGIAPRQVSGYDSTELTHAAVAAFVASGMADVGMGVQTAAHRFGLHFIPLLKERYFFALPADGLERDELRPVLAVLRSPAFRSRVAGLQGYEAARTGEMLTLAEALDG